MIPRHNRGSNTIQSPSLQKNVSLYQHHGTWFRQGLGYRQYPCGGVFFLVDPYSRANGAYIPINVLWLVFALFIIFVHQILYSPSNHCKRIENGVEQHWPVAAALFLRVVYGRCWPVKNLWQNKISKSLSQLDTFKFKSTIQNWKIKRKNSKAIKKESLFVINFLLIPPLFQVEESLLWIVTPTYSIRRTRSIW